MSIGWTRAYEEACKVSRFAPLSYEELAKLAKASYGDNGDRYICPFERKKIKAARRKARSMKSPYIVGAEGVRSRRFKKRASAIKCYKALKAEHGRAHFTNIALGVSIFGYADKVSDTTPAVEASSKLMIPHTKELVLHIPNRDMTTSPKMLAKVDKREVALGPVIEHEAPLVPIVSHNVPHERGGRLWAGQSSYIQKRLQQLKDHPVVRSFRTVQRDDIAALMVLAAVLISSAAINVHYVYALPR